MNPAAIIASIPAATSLVDGVARQVRAGSASFADTLGDALEGASRLPGTTSATVAQMFEDLGSQVAKLNLPATRAEADRAIDELRRLVRERLTGAGFEDVEPIELQLDPATGRITVVGEHPNRQRIEKVLNDDDVLVEAFAQLAESFDGTLRLKLDEPSDDQRDGIDG